MELPISKIKRIAKMDHDVGLISAEASILLTTAAELFIKNLALHLHHESLSKKRKTIQMKDVSAVFKYRPNLEFMDGVLETFNTTIIEDSCDANGQNAESAEVGQQLNVQPSIQNDQDEEISDIRLTHEKSSDSENQARLSRMNSLRTFLFNQLQYADMARYEQLGQICFTSHACVENNGKKVSTKFLASQCKRLATPGLMDCSAFLSHGAPPLTSGRDFNGSQESKTRGVLNRCEYYGPPLPIDGSFLLLTQCSAPPTLSPGCCHCRPASSLSYCSHSNDECKIKYAQLQSEVDKLKVQLSRLISGANDVVKQQSKTFAVNLGTTELYDCVGNSKKGGVARAPPPAPPPPPIDFLKAKHRSPLVTSRQNGKRACSSDSDEPSSEECDSSSEVRSPKFGLGGRDDEALAQMTQVLEDLKSGRVSLKPVLKSPGGTPRKRTLAVYRTAKTCHDLLAEALRSKFANVHRLQSPAGEVDATTFIGPTSLSDGDDAVGCSFDESDSSWLDTPTQRGSGAKKVAESCSNQNRVRTNSIS